MKRKGFNLLETKQHTFFQCKGCMYYFAKEFPGESVPRGLCTHPDVKSKEYPHPLSNIRLKKGYNPYKRRTRFEHGYYPRIERMRHCPGFHEGCWGVPIEHYPKMKRLPVWNPKIGQKVMLWYRKSAAADMPYHGRTGYVMKTSNGRGPLNAMIALRGAFVIVPQGNLREVS